MTDRSLSQELLDRARLVADRIAAQCESEAATFEVINPYTGEAFRIWANGHTEGFEKYGATLIINRIPQMLADA